MRLAGVPKALAWIAILAMIALAVAPMFHEFVTYGGHDWDTMAVNRYLAVKSFKTFGQFPFWNPYACGGHPGWGGIEGDTNVVSPFLPLYLTVPLQVAERFEVAAVAVLSAIGTWLLAGRFTRSAGLRLFACAVFVVNGRWALQATAGHLWHLYYAWTPYVLFFYDRAARPTPRDPAGRSNWPNAFAAGAFIALMVYTGAIYPLPQTVTLVALYAAGLAMAQRSLRPILLAAACGAVSFGLSAPKLMPVVDTLSRFPRHTDSPEVLTLGTLIPALITPEQTMGSHPAPTSAWGWHEWGMYIGWIPLVALLGALASVETRLERHLRAIGLVLLLVAAGSFHAYAPWPLLRRLPIFASQHVPSRWMYPSILVLAMAAVAVGERWLGRLRRRRPWAEIAVLVVAAWIAVDVGRQSSYATAGAFWMRLPHIEPSPTGFRQEHAIPPNLEYARRDWAPSALGAAMAGIGVIECNTFPGLNIYAKDRNGVIAGLGAVATSDPRYRGEVYDLENRDASASFVRWSPNEMVVAVHGAKPGDTLVLNQNWDPSWKADGVPAIRWEDKVATHLAASDAVVTFRYRPRTLPWAVGILAATVAAIAVVIRRERRRTDDAAPVSDLAA